MKAWKITASGAYYNNTDVVDYKNLNGIIPFCPERDIQSFVTARYIPQWISADERYPLRVTRVRETYIDSFEEVEVQKFSYVGKDIREMSFEELQDMATAKWLFAVPLKKGSLRAAQQAAYIAYLMVVMKEERPKDPFNLAKAAPIYVDENVRHPDTDNGSNEEAILGEQSQGIEMTLEDLKAVARGMGLSIKGNMSKEKLKDLIRGKAA